LRVGGELRRWQHGKVMAFDDSFEHAAFNRHPFRVRLVLIVDCW
jgi:hypothetical protein